MPAGIMTAWHAMPRRLVIPAVLVSLAAGLGSLVAGADAARIAGSPARLGTPVTAYVANIASETVTPIATATGTAGPPINVGRDPDAIAITPGTVTQAPVTVTRGRAGDSSAISAQTSGTGA
jgi:hypothetical protein